MKLTALDIKQQTFDKAFRGYDIAEVNAYLNLVANEWEHLVSRNKELERDLEHMREKLEHYQKVEEALHETLQTAKESAEQRLARSRKDAEDKIDKAEMEAENLIREARQQRQQIRQSILRLLDRRKEIIGGMQNYLEMAQESLNQFANDEARTFEIKDDLSEEESSFEKKLRLRSQTSEKNSGQSQGQQNKKGSGQADGSVPAGAEDLDEIIDDLD